MKTALLALSITLLAACSSTGGVADNADLNTYWTGMRVDQADKLWGKPVVTPEADGTRYVWAYRGCTINAIARDGYIADIQTKASERDACNIIFAQSRPKT